MNKLRPVKTYSDLSTLSLNIKQNLDEMKLIEEKITSSLKLKKEKQ